MWQRPFSKFAFLCLTKKKKKIEQIYLVKAEFKLVKLLRKSTLYVWISLGYKPKWVSAKNWRMVWPYFVLALLQMTFQFHSVRLFVQSCKWGFTTGIFKCLATTFSCFRCFFSDTATGQTSQWLLKCLLQASAVPRSQWPPTHTLWPSCGQNPDCCYKSSNRVRICQGNRVRIYQGNKIDMLCNREQMSQDKRISIC